MIPVLLHISGFLSYRDPVVLDFREFELACISGANGSGKSSLLDAITWVLFGQARRRDDTVINSHSKAAEIILEFEYEGMLYKVQRSKARDKPAVLEFYMQDSSASWRPLSERALRETEERIRSTLRMDYDTFINASFFLQGKADQFAQQRPGERKRILGSVLGLEAWEVYQARTAERRKKEEAGLAVIDGAIAEIDLELAQEEERRQRFEHLQAELKKLAELRHAKENELSYVRKLEESLAGQKRMLTYQENEFATTRNRLQQRSNDLKDRHAEAEIFHQRMEKAAEIEAGYRGWQDTRKALERWDELAANFREAEGQRQDLLLQIEAKRSRLDQQRQTLRSQGSELNKLVESLTELQKEIVQAESVLAGLKEQVGRQKELEKEVITIREAGAALKVENKNLSKEGKDLNERIAQLEQTGGAECPLCEQPLGMEDRDRLIVSLISERDEMRQRYSYNREQTELYEDNLARVSRELADLAHAEDELLQQQRLVDQHHARQQQIRSAQQTWQTSGAVQLQEVEKLLAEETYCGEAREALGKIDDSLKELGYDVSAHDQARRTEQQARVFEAQFHQLETARAALEPLLREITALEKQVDEDQTSCLAMEENYRQNLKKYEEDADSLPEVQQVESAYYDVKERENMLRLEVGGALQKVEILPQQRERREQFARQREEILLQIARLKTLERALGKDGVPALLIEQALPEIEIQANEILERLSAGVMSVRFATQKDYKDKNREDKKETLDILISDAAGDREYELFSGGEAFRINFAIRLALSRVLAQRAGARLQTLVIDEGFGSQDAEGRQRLIEAINLVRGDFAKVLVITHLEELKDTFPARIEVEKTAAGSVVNVSV
ncbi:MAG: SMC family ATPase [Anaerolineaceae bacterium]|nr:SMC family ATPase [Anaerolineaceae bacterium]